MISNVERNVNMYQQRQNKTEIWQLLSQVIKFGIVGVLNNVICLAVYYLVVLVNEELYLLGNVLGFLVSTLNAYLLNSRFVFREKDQTKAPKGSLYKTYATYMLSLGVSTGLLYMLVDVMQMSEKIAPLISLMITVPMNFILNKLWVYKKGGDCSGEN